MCKISLNEISKANNLAGALRQAQEFFAINVSLEPIGVGVWGIYNKYGAMAGYYVVRCDNFYKLGRVGDAYNSKEI